MISPSSEMESEDDDTSDTDDNADDGESVNIYEEALNCEDHAINRVTWTERKGKSAYFHQVKQNEIAYIYISIF